MGLSLAVRALSFTLFKLGLPSLFTTLFSLTVIAMITSEGTPSFTNPVIPADSSTPQPQPPAESAGSVSPSASSSVSLRGPASDETNSDKDEFLSAKSKSPASSSPSTGSDGCSPQKDSLEFLGDDQREFWTNEIIRAFNEGLAGVDPQGKIGKIPDNEIVNTLKLDSPFLSREEAEQICAALRKPWPSYEEADRTSIYTRVWGLLEKHQRPDI